MAKHLPVLLLAVAALVALAAAGPAPPPRGDGDDEHEHEHEHEHELEHEHVLVKRGLKKLFNKAKGKVKAAAHSVKATAKKVGAKAKGAAKTVAKKLNVNKVKSCLRQMPGLPKTALNVVEGCAVSALGGIPAVASCVGVSSVVPAVRATSHLAICMSQ